MSSFRGVNRLVQAFAVAAAFAISGSAAALVITDEFNFATFGQSMWKEGGAANLFGETRITSKWGNKIAGEEPESLVMGGISGKSSEKLPGTGVDIPNPAYYAW